MVLKQCQHCMNWNQTMPVKNFNSFKIPHIPECKLIFLLKLLPLKRIWSLTLFWRLKPITLRKVFGEEISSKWLQPKVILDMFTGLKSIHLQEFRSEDDNALENSVIGLQKALMMSKMHERTPNETVPCVKKKRI